MEETKLDRETIVHTALQLMRDDGIDGFSMRKLGAQLNIRAPTLYWYFSDRSAILRAVINTLLAETVHSVSDCATWQEWLQRFGHALWITSRDTPVVTMLLQSSEINDTEVFDFAIAMLDRQMERFGVNRDIYLGAHSDIQAYVLGWAVFQHAGVVGRISEMLDVEASVRNGISNIVNAWSAKAGSS
jgi:AcrR family transcriptional regulator